jgi:hypothetical protein
MVAGLSVAGGEIPLRVAVSIFVAAVVYVAQMLVVLKVAASRTRSWRIAGGTSQNIIGQTVAPVQGAVAVRTGAHGDGGATTMMSERVRTAVGFLENRVSTNRLTHLSRTAQPAGHGQLEMAGLITSPASAKHGSYFNHRTPRVSSEIPRKLIR